MIGNISFDLCVARVHLKYALFDNMEKNSFVFFVNTFCLWHFEY